jgi:hypothetical protein
MKSVLGATEKIAPVTPAGAEAGTVTAPIGIKAPKVDNMMPSRQQQCNGGS